MLTCVAAAVVALLATVLRGRRVRLSATGLLRDLVLGVVVAVAATVALLPVLDRIPAGTTALRLGMTLPAVLLGLTGAVTMATAGSLTAWVLAPDAPAGQYFFLPLGAAVLARFVLLGPARMAAVRDLLRDGRPRIRQALLWTVAAALAVAAVVTTTWVLLAVAAGYALWLRRIAGLPAPWLRQQARFEAGRVAAIAVVAFGPFGAALVATLDAAPAWQVMLCAPPLALALRFVAGIRGRAGTRSLVAAVLVQGGLLAALLAMRHPGAPALTGTALVILAADLHLHYRYGAAPLYARVVTDLIGLNPVSRAGLLDEWAGRRGRDGSLIVHLIGAANQGLADPQRAGAARDAATLGGALRGNDDDTGWADIADEAIEAVAGTGRDVRVFRYHRAQHDVLAARRDSDPAGAVEAWREAVAALGGTGLAGLRQAAETQLARALFAARRDDEAIALLDAMLARPDLVPYARIDACLVRALAAVIDDDPRSAERLRAQAAAVRIRPRDRWRCRAEARTLLAGSSGRWLRAPREIEGQLRWFRRLFTLPDFDPGRVLQIWEMSGSTSAEPR